MRTLLQIIKHFFPSFLIYLLHSFSFFFYLSYSVLFIFFFFITKPFWSHFLKSFFFLPLQYLTSRLHLLRFFLLTLQSKCSNRWEISAIFLFYTTGGGAFLSNSSFFPPLFVPFLAQWECNRRSKETPWSLPTLSKVYSVSWYFCQPLLSLPFIFVFLVHFPPSDRPHLSHTGWISPFAQLEATMKRWQACERNRSHVRRWQAFFFYKLEGLSDACSLGEAVISRSLLLVLLAIGFLSIRASHLQPIFFLFTWLALVFTSSF